MEREYTFSFIGGLIIGIATSLNLALMGRVTGFSGIFNTLIKLDRKSGLRWKFSFLVGFLYAGFMMYHTSKDGIITLKGLSFAKLDTEGIRV